MSPIDERAFLSTIWILSCTDKIPQMTYRGIRERVDTNLSDDQIKSVIDKRVELFREGIPTVQLNRWKDEMKSGKNRASWIANSPRNEQENIIDSLNKKDIFRNRFRNKLDSGPTPVNIIEWGLNHIEDMYKLQSERSEGRKQSIISIWIPLISLLIAGLSIYTSYSTNNSKIEAEKFKTRLTYKQKGYSKFMTDFTTVTTATVDRNKDELFTALQGINQSYYEIEPFIPSSQREDIYQQFLNFQGISTLYVNDSTSRESYLENNLMYRNYFREELAPKVE